MTNRIRDCYGWMHKGAILPFLVKGQVVVGKLVGLQEDRVALEKGGDTYRTQYLEIKAGPKGDERVYLCEREVVQDDLPEPQDVQLGAHPWDRLPRARLRRKSRKKAG